MKTAIHALALSRSIREELASFIAKSEGVDKEEVIQRINERGQELSKTIASEYEDLLP
ncbi:MAG: hypothetical protein RSO15_17085 [Bacteroides sp.]|uniref:hypothetical protein n=1 Tax=Bacteroides sp. TaxID=29523 RepID=UPI002FC96808